MKKGTYYYNKEIILSEIGSILGGPLGGIISNQLTKNNSTISLATLAGAVMGSSLMWLILRIYDDKKRKEYSRKKLFKEILYFAPAATILAILFVYPTIYYGTKIFLELGTPTTIASFIGPFLGLLVFLAVMNLYRKALKKRKDIEL